VIDDQGSLPRIVYDAGSEGDRGSLEQRFAHAWQSALENGRVVVSRDDSTVALTAALPGESGPLGVISIVADDIDVSKPELSFFEKALVRAEAPASRCLMIGDHLENDILAARDAGIKTCLIDRNGKYNDDQRVPGDVIRITSMEDLLEFLPDRTQSPSQPLDQ